jgi:hypothetical protein
MNPTAVRFLSNVVCTTIGFIGGYYTGKFIATADQVKASMVAEDARISAPDDVAAAAEAIRVVEEAISKLAEADDALPNMTKIKKGS